MIAMLIMNSAGCNGGDAGQAGEASEVGEVSEAGESSEVNDVNDTEDVSDVNESNESNESSEVNDGGHVHDAGDAREDNNANNANNANGVNEVNDVNDVIEVGHTDVYYTDNITKNGDFEESVTHWRIPEGTAKVDSQTFRNGKHSLYYLNEDPEQYETFTQDIPALPGEVLHFSVWVKGAGIRQPTGQPPTAFDGAGIYLQSYDENGVYIDGVFPDCLLGTFDWQEVKGKAIIPPNAARVSIGLYLRKGSVGQVWFDDVTVRKEAPPLMQTYLTYPNYRHTLQSGDLHAWKVKIVHHLPADEEGFFIQHEVKDAEQKVLFSETLPVSQWDEGVVFQPQQPLDVGTYSWELRLMDGQQTLRHSEQLEITVQEQMPHIYVDPNGFTVIDQEKFFPLGTYLIRDWSHSEENLQRIADAGFNTLLSYTYGEASDAEQFLDRAHRHGFKVIYNLVDMYLGDQAKKRRDGKDPFEVAASYIQKLNDHPALLAWYINDEFDLNWMPEMEKMYQLIKELDPDHPVYQVHNQMGILEKYFDVTDVLGTDPYPVGDRGGEDTDLTMTSTFASHTAHVTHGAKGIWMVPQMHDLSVYYADRKPNQPDAREMLNQAYQDLIHGAKGLIFYSFFDLWYPDLSRLPDEDVFQKNWPDVVQMMAEMEKVIPVIMNDNQYPLSVMDQNPSVEIAAYEYQQRLHVLLANPYYEKRSVSVSLPPGWRVQEQTQGGITSKSSQTEITFELPAVGSGMFILEKN